MWVPVWELASSRVTLYSSPSAIEATWSMRKGGSPSQTIIPVRRETLMSISSTAGD